MSKAFPASPSDQPVERGVVRRIALLDILRGLALVAMAIYHFAWDLEFFGYIEAGTTGAGGWKLFARLIAGSFLFLAGVSLVLGHRPAFRLRPFMIRFAKVAGAALVISIATWFAVPDGFIFFGILHSIAAASIIGLLFLRAPVPIILVAALAAFSAPSYARAPFFDSPALWWVGLSTSPIRSNDYVPILPWLAPFLLGMALAKFAQSAGWLVAMAKAVGERSWWTAGLARAGRHSLAIYLIHQPVLIGLVYLFSLLAPAAPPDPVEAYKKDCVAACTAQQDKQFCSLFCDCTLDRLMEQNLFNDLITGSLDVNTDPRVAEMSRQCSMEIPPKD